MLEASLALMWLHLNGPVANDHDTDPPEAA